MAERTTYTPGTFSWTDLTTTDQEAAKSFYSGLFGWEAQDNPVGDGIVYSTMLIDGKPVGAISPQPDAQRDAGVPPAWNSYITVQSADAALERARHLGAEVHAPAFDVLDVGRMGVIQDPQGAFVLVWEPKTHIGASLVNAHGALCWNELATADMDASATFYGELFGWTFTPMEGEMPYLVIQNADGRSNGGVRLRMESEPPYWLVYFGANELEATIARAGELGGATIVEPMQIGPGRIAVGQDPQGAVFALYRGQFDD
jgi:predicted enzyme related to lactoylglutathione lyase